MTAASLYIVDDDDIVRSSLQSLMATRPGLLIRGFRSGDQFLEAAPALDPGCVLLDLHMPGLSGIEVLGRITPLPARFAAIMLTGQGDIARAVQAMKAGAIDFLEKPCDHMLLMQAIDTAFDRLAAHGAEAARIEAARTKIGLLSPRELDVLGGLIDGRSNKLIAHDLDISPRTVEIYRAKLMEKLEVRSLSEALRIAFAAGVIPRSRVVQS